MSQFKVLKVGQATLAKFAGKVTIDGQPRAAAGAGATHHLVRSKESRQEQRPLSAACQKDGRFEFYTYAKADGAPVGSYVVLFAELTNNRARGFVQPDGLKNLYDDPDKNAQNPEFVVELDHREGPTTPSIWNSPAKTRLLPAHMPLPRS